MKPVQRVVFELDHKVEGGERLVQWASSVVESALGHLGNHLTRVEVHMNVESGSREDPQEFRVAADPDELAT